MSRQRSVGLAIALMLGVAASRACHKSELVAGTTVLPVMPPFVMLWAVACCLTAIAAWFIVRRTGNAMKLARHLSICIAWVAIMVTPVSAQSQDLSRYRQFRLGMTLEALTHEFGPTTEVRVIHRRPALIQELVWSPPRPLARRSDEEAVREVLFTFYEGELCRMLDRVQTAGERKGSRPMTSSRRWPRSMVLRPGRAWRSCRQSRRGPTSATRILANWQDARYALTLFRPSYLSSFGLVMTERRLDGLARRAIKEARSARPSRGS